MDRALRHASGRADHIDKSALTLVEFLAGAAITLLIISIAWTGYLMMHTAWEDANADLEMQRSANLAMERLMRGFNAASDTAPRGLLDARGFNIDTPSRIRFVSGIDSKERAFYLENGILMYDPDTSAGQDEIAAAKNISGLVFSAYPENPSKAVSMSVTASKDVRGINRAITLSGTAFLRNG